MASTTEGAALTEAHRRTQVALRRLTATELAAIIPMIEFARISDTWPAVEAAIVRLVAQRRRNSSLLAANYMRRFRRAEGVAGAFTAAAPSPLDVERLIRNLRIVGPGKAGNLVRLGAPNVEALTFTSLEGEVSRQVLNGNRETTMNSVASDRQAIGWQRVTDGDPCAFCAMLASRGPVYTKGDLATSGSVWVDKMRSDGVKVTGFRAHAHCACVAEPIYSQDSEWVGRSAEFRDLWDESTEGYSGKGALNAFRRALSS